jgi:hypothetical protein
MSAYRVSFIPKKSSASIDPKSVECLRGMFSCIAGVIKQNLSGKAEKGGKEQNAIRHCLATIRNCSVTLIESGKLRTICAPNETLKATQRAIMNNLSRIPCHQSAHGFVRNRDSFTCAMAHTEYWGSLANNLVILNMDAKNFFHSITSQVVKTSLAAHGLKEREIDGVIATCMVRADEELASSVLHGLFRLFMEKIKIIIPDDERNHELIQNMLKGDDPLPGAPQPYSVPEGFAKQVAFVICQGFLSLGSGVTMVNKFLPQGSPTSPVLSNLAMKIVDIRLSAMAKSFGGFYTRYADDLTVSWQVPTKGKIIDSMYRCSNLVLADYKIILNRRKKRVMGKGRRQDIVGFCVNSGRPTISKQIRGRIRAAVHSEFVRGSERLKSGKRSPGAYEDHSALNPSPRRVSYLMGHIGRLELSHPKEAEKYKQMLGVAMDRSTGNLHEIVPSNDELDYLP